MSEGPQQPPTGQEPSGTPAQPPAATPPSGASNGLAITALVLGVVAVIFAFIPVFGAVIALPGGLAAIVVGVIGRGRAKQVGGGSLAIAGIITGAAGIVIALLWGVLAGVVFTGIERDLREMIDEVDAAVALLAARAA